MRKLMREEDILNKDFRVQVIKEIVDGRENLDRKNASLRRHEIYRDNIKKWVAKSIESEGYKEATVKQMVNRATNVSIAKKIVNKLAQTYNGGVERTVEDEASQESIDALADELDFNTKMKKSDRFRQLFRNTMAQIVPIIDSVQSIAAAKPLWYICVRALADWQYDVLEDPHDDTKPMVVILSDFTERNQYDTIANYYARQAEGFRGPQGISASEGDRVDQAIADTPGDKGIENRQFIWWSPRFHFTTDIKGEILSTGGDGSNPIGLLPFVNICGDQDGSFWAQGGDDVVEGTVLLNKKLTDANYIWFAQGFGQLVIACQNPPKALKGGPDNAFIFEKTDPQENVQVYYASSNPMIAEALESIRMQLALLLSTNDLSVRNIAAKLDASNVASGIVLMIENSEVIADVKDVQTTFQDAEPEIWERIRRFHELYARTNSLVPSQQAIPIFTDSNVKLKFIEVRAPISDKEKLETMKLKKDLGIATLKDLVRMDNPDLTDEDADKKVEELLADRKKMSSFLGDTFKKMNGGNNGNLQEEEQTEEEEQEEGQEEIAQS